MTNLLDELKSSIGSITVSLPTGGEWYDEGTWAEGTDFSSILVNPFTMNESINFQNPFKLMNGSAVLDMVRHTCPLIKHPENLLNIDIETISIAAKIASHGRYSTLEITCSNPAEVERDGKMVKACEDVSKVKVDLEKALFAYTTMPGREKMSIQMDNGHRVFLRPPSYLNSVTHIKKMHEARKIADAKGLQDETLLEKIINDTGIIQKDFVIDIIYGITDSKGTLYRDRSSVEQWIEGAPDTWLEAIRDFFIEVMEPFTNLDTIDYSCPSCNHVQKVSISGDPVRFFTTASRNKMTSTQF